MQEIYLSVDLERDEFNISQAVFKSPMPASDTVTILPKNGTSDLIPRPPGAGGKKLPMGAIVGIAVGIVGLLLLLGGAGWWVWRRKHKSDTYAGAEDTQLSDDKKDPNGLEVDHTREGLKVNKPSDGDARTNFELDGGHVSEMYAPHGESEMHYSETVRQVNTGLVEAEGTSPMYELASPDEVRRAV
jgi:hypothetical protein